MKKGLLVLCAIAISLSVFAQGKGVTYQEVRISKSDSTQSEILNQLIEIRKNQETEKSARDSIRKSRFNDAVQHKADSTDIPSNEYGAILRVADNTSFDSKAKVAWWVAILALIVSAVSMYYAIITYKAQKETEINTKKAEENTKKAEQNTKRVSLEAQRGLLSELLRHLYRNYVITFTMRTKVKETNFSCYPSEEHFEKLKIPMENIHLDVFYGEDKNHLQLMHVLYLNLRNYNTEVDVALKHIASPDIPNEVKEEDFDTLEFKVSYLTGKIYDTIMDIWGEKDEFRDEMRNAIKLSLSGKTNAKKNVDVLFSNEFDPLTFETIKNTQYTKLYSDEELTEFCEIFNNDVREERKKNARGAWKVRMIKF